jgi:4,5-dihydroxyphthalate decarboxylase
LSAAPRHAPGRASLKVLLGDYPVTSALRGGAISSPSLALEFDEASKLPQTGFKRAVRKLEFDVAEIAIVTFLMAKARGVPLVLLPAVVLAREAHPFLVYDASRGALSPRDLAGKRVGVRSYSVTTGMWVRSILEDDHGVDCATISWTTFEEAHVADFRDPPNVERAGVGREITEMLLAGELDAAIVGKVTGLASGIEPVIPDPEEAAMDWRTKHGAIQLNHLVAVKDTLPEAQVREFWRLLVESRKDAGDPPGRPFGLEANRRNLEVAIERVHRQGLIPRRYAVDELFSDVTRSL